MCMQSFLVWIVVQACLLSQLLSPALKMNVLLERTTSCWSAADNKSRNRRTPSVEIRRVQSLRAVCTLKVSVSPPVSDDLRSSALNPACCVVKSLKLPA